MEDQTPREADGLTTPTAVQHPYLSAPPGTVPDFRADSRETNAEGSRPSSLCRDHSDGRRPFTVTGCKSTEDSKEGTVQESAGTASHANPPRTPQPSLSISFDTLTPRGPPALSAPFAPALAAPLDHPYDQRVHILEQAREELQDARDELLGTRFALRTQRSNLTDIRQRTGAAEGVLMNYIRLFIEQQYQVPFSDIERQYQIVLDSRDELGNAEVEYEQAEQRYNRLEWKYTQKEDEFFESLRSPGSSSPRHVSTTQFVEEARELTEFTYEEADPSGLNPIPGTLQSDASLLHGISPEIPDLEIKSVNVLGFAPPGLSCIGLDRGETPLSFPTHPGSTGLSLPSLPNSESAIATAPWPETLKRIDSWIYETVRCSSLQQARLRYLLLQEGLDDPHWWSLVERHWRTRDMPDPRPTEDTSSRSNASGVLPCSASLVSTARNPVSRNQPEHPAMEENVTILQQPGQYIPLFPDSNVHDTPISSSDPLPVDKISIEPSTMHKQPNDQLMMMENTPTSQQCNPPPECSGFSLVNSTDTGKLSEPEKPLERAHHISRAPNGLVHPDHSEKLTTQREVFPRLTRAISNPETGHDWNQVDDHLPSEPPAGPLDWSSVNLFPQWQPSSKLKYTMVYANQGFQHQDAPFKHHRRALSVRLCP